MRATAHKIADLIYEKLTGDVGVFSTRIAYIVKSGTRYELQVADADGYGAQTVLASNEPIISPSWSPDGTRLAYVSFERKKPIIYVQSLVSGQRQVLAKFKGNNSAPAWSPDGKQLAMVLTKDGSSQIYLINADGSGVKRLSYSSGIDTEPSFSPDGAVDHIHFGPRRQPADLPHVGQRQRRAAPDFRGQLQRFPALQPGRQELHLYPARQRFCLSCRAAGSGVRPDASADGYAHGRIAQFRAQRQNDTICH